MSSQEKPVKHQGDCLFSLLTYPGSPVTRTTSSQLEISQGQPTCPSGWKLFRLFQSADACQCGSSNVDPVDRSDNHITLTLTWVTKAWGSPTSLHLNLSDLFPTIQLGPPPHKFQKSWTDHLCAGEQSTPFYIRKATLLESLYKIIIRQGRQGIWLTVGLV